MSFKRRVQESYDDPDQDVLPVQRAKLESGVRDYLPKVSLGAYLEGGGGDTLASMMGRSKDQHAANARMTELGIATLAPRIPPQPAALSTELLHKAGFHKTNEDPVYCGTLIWADLMDLWKFATTQELEGTTFDFLLQAHEDPQAFHEMSKGYQGTIDVEWTKTKVGSYRPKFRDIPPYKPVFMAWLEYTTDTPYVVLGLDGTSARKYRDFLALMTHHYCLSDGTTQGMLGRMNACDAVALEVSKLPGAVDLLELIGVSPMEAMHEMWGLTAFAVDDDLEVESVPDLAKPTVMKKFMKINKNSDTGLPFDKDIKRASTFWTDAYTSTLMALTVNLDERVKAQITGLNTTRCKPKFEVTKTSARTTKTRNIKVMPSWLQVHAGVLLQRAFTGNHRALRPATDRGGPESHSLFGFSAWHCGLHDTVVTMIERCETVYWVFYSDNVFAVERTPTGVEFHSFDGEKMEASSDAAEGRLGVEYIIKAGIGVEDDALLEWAKFFISDLAHDQVSVIGDTWFRQPGLGSGAQGTFAINHARMSMTCYLLTARSQSPSAVRVGERIPGENGRVLLKKEVDSVYATTAEYATSVYPITISPHPPVYISLTEAMAASPKKFGPIVRLDLLGHDACVKVVDGEPVLCACLTYERLMRALPYRDKSSISRTVDGVNTETVDVLIAIMVYAGYYYQGGYAYEDAHNIINAVVIHLYNSNRKLLTDMVAKPEVWVEALRESVRRMLDGVEADFDETLRILTNIANQAFSVLSKTGEGSRIPFQPDDPLLIDLLAKPKTRSE